jgi:hypothetical protein
MLQLERTRRAGSLNSIKLRFEDFDPFGSRRRSPADLIWVNVATTGRGHYIHKSDFL